VRSRALIKTFAILLSTAACTSSAAGALIVNVGSYNVAAGTPIVAQITVSNSAAASISDIEGMTFTVQLATGVGAAPKVTSVDLLTGTVWAGHVSAGSVFMPAGGDLPQYQSRDLLTDAPANFINANGLLATVVVDTTGAAAGNYDLKLIGTKTSGRDSAFLSGLGAVVQASFGQGLITVTVPEPTAQPIIATLLLLTGMRRERR
jgi:hypothetical protein